MHIFFHRKKGTRRAEEGAEGGRSVWRGSERGIGEACGGKKNKEGNGIAMDERTTYFRPLFRRSGMEYTFLWEDGKQHVWGTTGRRMKNTRWLCVVSVALNVAEAKVVAASLYGPLPPTLSPRSSSPFFHSHHNIFFVYRSSILPCSRHRVLEILSFFFFSTSSLL